MSIFNDDRHDGCFYLAVITVTVAGTFAWFIWHAR